MKKIYFFITLLFLHLAQPSKAETFRLGILHGDPEVFSYEISVIQLALQNMGSEHTLELVLLPDTTQERILNMLERGQDINLFFTGYSQAREQRFLQVDIPLTRGLLGSRVFIRKTGAFPLINNLEDLKKKQIGSGIGWPDTEILSQAGFNVTTSTYKNLWKMLEHGRYDLFNRGINEAYIELEQQKRQGRNFEIEPNILVSYPYDYFIYLNAESHSLHKILNEGLLRSYANGSFLENFKRHPATSQAIKTASTFRSILKIPNPLLSERAKKIPAKFWHNF